MGVQLQADVGPVVHENRVMPVGLSQEGHAGHEGKCLLKMGKPELPNQTLIPLNPHDIVAMVRREINQFPGRNLTLAP
jgi:hypothetical protein